MTQRIRRLRRINVVVSVLLATLFAMISYDLCKKEVLRAHYEKMTNYEFANVGDVVWFGRYEQNGNILDGPENLEWIVLEKEEDSLLLLSRNVIFAEEVSDLPWEENPVRTLLNQEFFYEAFLDEVKNRMNKSVVPWMQERWVSIDFTVAEDAVFLLNDKEIQLFLPSTEERHSQWTQSMLSSGFESEVTWALRPSEDRPGVIPYVDTDGLIQYASQENGMILGIRPVVLIWY